MPSQMGGGMHFGEALGTKKNPTNGNSNKILAPEQKKLAPVGPGRRGPTGRHIPLANQPTFVRSKTSTTKREEHDRHPSAGQNDLAGIRYKGQRDASLTTTPQQ